MRFIRIIKENRLRIRKYLEQDIWRIHLTELPVLRALFIRLLRIVMIVFRGISQGRLANRSATLTYYSLLAIVPFLAILFGISKGFGGEDYLKNFISGSLPLHEEAMNRFIDFASKLLEKTRGDLLAGIAFIVLIWTVVLVLNTVERTFNNIWQIYKKRSFVRKFTDYLALILLAPALIILSSTLNVYISSQLDNLSSKVEFLQYFSPVMVFIARLTPFLLIWLLLIFVYTIFPNTRVRFRSAVIAAVVAGTIYQVVQWYYIKFQAGVSSYNAIYGSFAAFPLFLVWLNISWTIILLGAEISFAEQNVDNYDFEENSLRLSHSHKQLLSIMILQRIIRQFEEGKKPLTAMEIAVDLGIPGRLTNQLINQLVDSTLVSETTDKEMNESGFQPARAIPTITIYSVMSTLDRYGKDDLPVKDIHLLHKLEEKIAALRATLEKHPSNMLLKDLH
jgi:membrane protein